MCQTRNNTSIHHHCKHCRAPAPARCARPVGEGWTCMRQAGCGLALLPHAHAVVCCTLHGKPPVCLRSGGRPPARPEGAGGVLPLPCMLLPCVLLPHRLYSCPCRGKLAPKPAAGGVLPSLPCLKPAGALASTAPHLGAALAGALPAMRLPPPMRPHVCGFGSSAPQLPPGRLPKGLALPGIGLLTTPEHVRCWAAGSGCRPVRPRAPGGVLGCLLPWEVSGRMETLACSQQEHGRWSGETAPEWLSRKLLPYSTSHDRASSGYPHHAHPV